MRNILNVLVVVAVIFLFSGCAGFLDQYETSTYYEENKVTQNGREVQKVEKTVKVTEPRYSSSSPLYYNGWVSGRNGYFYYNNYNNGYGRYNGYNSGPRFFFYNGAYRDQAGREVAPSYLRDIGVLPKYYR